MAHRLIVLLLAAVLAVAAPARAWCEATCGAPATASRSHCPGHEPATTDTHVAGPAIDECPAVDSARPTTPARLDAPMLAAKAAPAPDLKPRSQFLPAPLRPSSATTVFERSTPLRI